MFSLSSDLGFGAGLIIGYLGDGENEEAFETPFSLIVYTVLRRLAVCLLILELSEALSEWPDLSPLLIPPIISSFDTREFNILQSFSEELSTSFILATSSLCLLTPV